MTTVDELTFSIACHDGDLDTIRQMGTYIKSIPLFHTEHLNTACCQNQVAVVKYLVLQVKVPVTEAQLDIACFRGHLDLVEFLVQDLKMKFRDKHLILVCAGGYLNLLQFLCSQEIHYDGGLSLITTSHLTVACSYGHLEIFRFLVQQFPVVPDNHHLLIACHEGHFDLVHWFLDLGFQPKPNHLAAACSQGRLEIVNLLAQYGDLEFTDQHLILACVGAHPKLFQALVLEHKVKPRELHLSICCLWYKGPRSLAIIQFLNRDCGVQCQPVHLYLACSRLESFLVRFLVTKVGLKVTPSCVAEVQRLGDFTLAQFLTSNLSPDPETVEDSPCGIDWLLA